MKAKFFHIGNILSISMLSNLITATYHSTVLFHKEVNKTRVSNFYTVFSADFFFKFNFYKLLHYYYSYLKNVTSINKNYSVVLFPILILIFNSTIYVHTAIAYKLQIYVIWSFILVLFIYMFLFISHTCV